MAKGTQPYSRKVVTTGVAGAASGSNTVKGARGLLTRVAVNWHASAPATSDITITETWDGGSKVLYTTTDSAADYDKPNVVVTNEATQYLPVALVGGTITIAVTGCNALDPAVIVTLVITD